MVVELIKRTLFNFLQFLVKYFNSFLIKCHHAGMISSERAEVYKIILRYKDTERFFSWLDDFILLFEGFASPEIVLNDDVSLYTINTTEAIFVDCKSDDIFHSSRHMFVYNAQFDLSRKVIHLPLAQFYKIASTITLPNIPILHLPNHGRCGSTALQKLIEEIPDTLSVAEMFAFTDLAVLSQEGFIEREELKKLCRAIIMCTVKHSNSRNSKLLFMKFQHIVTYVTDIMMEVVPEIKHIYMYRQPIAFVRSWEKLILANKWDELCEEMETWSGLGNNEILRDYPNYDYEYMNKLTFFAKISLLWITGVAAFKKLVYDGHPIPSLKYEDFLSHPRETFVSILEYLSIDLSTFRPDIDSIMSTDSQAGTEFSTRHFDKKKLETSFTPISKVLIDELNGLCSDFNVPLFWDDIHLGNNIIGNVV